MRPKNIEVDQLALALTLVDSQVMLVTPSIAIVIDAGVQVC